MMTNWICLIVVRRSVKAPATPRRGATRRPEKCCPVIGTRASHGNLPRVTCHRSLTSLYVRVAKHNAASLRVLQKCGFTFLDSAGAAPDGSDDSHVLLVLTAG